MSKTNCMTYVSTNELTYIQADSGREVCSMTKCSLVDTTRIVEACSEVTGISVEDTKALLRSYPAFKPEELLRHEPAECLYFHSGKNPETGEPRIATLLVRANIEDHLEELKQQLLLTE